MRERPTIPAWRPAETNRENQAEGEPVWEGIGVGQIEAQGRDHVEDKTVGQDGFEVIESFGEKGDSFWAGVYDGHYMSGDYLDREEVSPEKVAAQMMTSLFAKEIKKGKTKEEAFAVAFAKVDKEIAKLGYGGTTATALLVEGVDCWVANVGDSYAYRFAKGRPPERLTADHNIRSNKQAQREAISRGGVYAKGYIMKPGAVGVALARSLGDRDMEEVVSSEPEVKNFKIRDNDEWIVLASDGLWDELRPFEVDDILEESGNAKEAQAKIIETLKSKNNFDDATVIVIKLKK